MQKPQGNDYLDLKVGYSCNNNCIHCVIQDHKKALIDQGKKIDCSFEQCSELINKAVAGKVGAITITGGEPTIRKDFFSILDLCRSNNLKVGVQTNGRNFHDPHFFAQLNGFENVSFVIALHGPDPSIHDAITRRQGSFDETVQGIRNLLDSGFNVIGKLVISTINANHLAQTLCFLHELGIEQANFAFPHALGNARINFHKVVPRYTNIRLEIDELIRVADKLEFSLSLETFPMCTLSDPSYCSEYQYLSNRRRLCIPANEDEFNWDEKRALDKHKFIQCEKCCFDHLCEGPWKEYPKAYGDDEFVPMQNESLMNLLQKALIKTST